MTQRVLLVQPSINPPGGGNAVAAWILEGLRDRCELSLLCWDPPRLDAVNHIYGTSLSPDDFALHGVPRMLRGAIDAIRSPLALLKMGVLKRVMRPLERQRPFDVVISANNEFDFGRRGIQYIHYPSLKDTRPSIDYRWYHRPPGVVTAYRAMAIRLAGVSIPRTRENLSLVNSVFIGEVFRSTHGVEPQVLYPPVPGDFPDIPWEAREDGFVCAGRISAEKDLEKVIEILAGVRARGRDVTLHIVGDHNTGRYATHIAEIARRNASWIRLHIDVSRQQLVELMASNRYGLHGMRVEPFGIAVAELQRAGCIVFAPDDGGPVEILGGDQRVLYASPADAIEKIDRVLGDATHRAEVRDSAHERRDQFSAERFVEGIRAVVADF